MRFGPKRGSFVFIFDNFIKDFGLLIIALIIAWIKKDISVIFDNIAVFAIVIVGPISRILKYLFTYYSIDDEKLIVKSGWLSRKSLEVPLSTITTVDFTQNIVHQIFGVYRLNVDNASNVGSQQTKIQMTFGKEDAFIVRQLLTEGKSGIDGVNIFSSGDEKIIECDRDICISTKDILLMGAIKSKSVFLLSFFAIMSSAGAFIGNIVELPDEKIENFFFSILKNGNILYSVIVFAFIVFVTGIICGSVGSLIQFYGFRILDNGERIKIEYGLLTKKRYIIQKKKITGFYYTQSLLMRFLHTGTLRIFAIGYGKASDGDSNEDPVIFPLIKENILQKTMGEILPEISETDEYCKPQPNAFRYFFYSKILVISIAVTVLLIWVSFNIKYIETIWIIGVILIILSIISIVMQYYNTGIYGNEKCISISRGGFNKSIFFIKTNNVERISEVAGILKHRKNITTVTIGYIAPLGLANQYARNVSVEVFEKIKEKIIY